MAEHRAATRRDLLHVLAGCGLLVAALYGLLWRWPWLLVQGAPWIALFGLLLAGAALGVLAVAGVRAYRRRRPRRLSPRRPGAHRG